MHRIDTPEAVGGLFSDGNPGTGMPGTNVDADFMNAVQEEIASFIEAEGITLVKGTNTQLRAAVAANTAASPRVLRARGVISLGGATPFEPTLVLGFGLGTPTRVDAQTLRVPLLVDQVDYYTVIAQCIGMSGNLVGIGSPAVFPAVYGIADSYFDIVGVKAVDGSIVTLDGLSTNNIHVLMFGGV